MDRPADSIGKPPSGRVEKSAGRSARRATGETGAGVAFDILDSPIGDLTALVTRRGLLALAFDTDDLDRLMEKVARRVSPGIVRSSAEVVEVRSWLDSYFDGHPVPDIRIDRSLMTPFQERVLAAAAGIPPGEVRTYGEVAVLTGNPKAARATGRALGSNPIPVVLPCHRVVAADGRLHGYAGGIDRKRLLLEHEKAIAGR